MTTSDLLFSGGGRERMLTVVRRRGAKSMRLSIDPRDASVRLSLPLRAPLRPAISWAAGKRAWIEAELAKMPQAQPIVPGMRFVLGGREVVLDWNASYPRTLRLVENSDMQTRHPELVSGSILQHKPLVPTEEWMLKQVQHDGLVGSVLQVGGPLERLSTRVIRYLNREALRILDQETRDLAEQHGIIIGKVGVGDPRARWGSCASGGDIRYSWRLILAPDFVRQATVAHEVAHRVHMDHSPKFHALVADLLDSDPKPARQWLRAHGTALHWFGRDG